MGHPDDKDLAVAVEFYNGLTEQASVSEIEKHWLFL